ncbi:unnamed protein product [Trichogramma brassicae]|uniref:Uncharacterized protein n=1 Tax=Trichogramma brassicae TaxID=86971 RepID=A0A6H5ID32_9HYME|nr:unnamed protein product [Trichogramma brassicae]
MLKQEREFIVNELLSSKFLKDIAAKNVHNEAKDPEESDRYRKEGNALYALSGHSAVIHEKILTRYTQSLAFAPANSLQMALAYSNRSALFYHCGKYVDCMLDIERAMRYEPLCIKIKKKLIDRKVMCMKYFDGEIIKRRTGVETIRSIKSHNFVPDREDERAIVIHKVVAVLNVVTVTLVLCCCWCIIDVARCYKTARARALRPRRRSPEFRRHIVL